MKKRKLMIEATMDDLEWINKLLRDPQNKKAFPSLRKDLIIERLEKGGCVFKTSKKDYCEIINVYQVKKVFAIGEKLGPIFTKPGDIRLHFAAIKNKNKGLGTKYQKYLIKHILGENKTYFARVNTENKRSIRYLEKSGMTFLDTYKKGKMTYYIYAINYKKSKRIGDFLK